MVSVPRNASMENAPKAKRVKKDVVFPTRRVVLSHVPKDISAKADNALIDVPLCNVPMVSHVGKANVSCKTVTHWAAHKVKSAKKAFVLKIHALNSNVQTNNTAKMVVVFQVAKT